LTRRHDILAALSAKVIYANHLLAIYSGTDCLLEARNAERQGLKLPTSNATIRAASVTYRILHAHVGC
jgi:hypothetical protein